MISLNVGGVVFMCTMSTLQSFPASSLARMFSSPHQLPPRDASGAFLLDSSPAMFGYVLDWCRYRQLVVDKDNMNWGSLEVVADYFGLEEMLVEVRRRKEQEVDKEDQLKRERLEHKREIISILEQMRDQVVQIGHSLRGGYPRGPPRFPHPDPHFPDP